MGARAASSHTGALAGNDKIYDDVLRQSGVIRARSLREMLEFARALPILPTPRGENIVIITGAGGSGVLLSDAVVDNGLSLMAMPADLDTAFRSEPSARRESTAYRCASGFRPEDTSACPGASTWSRDLNSHPLAVFT
jgi:acyl-CoA synthetase (NDP forming)